MIDKKVWRSKSARNDWQKMLDLAGSPPSPLCQAYFLFISPAIASRISSLLWAYFCPRTAFARILMAVNCPSTSIHCLNSSLQKRVCWLLSFCIIPYLIFCIVLKSSECPPRTSLAAQQGQEGLRLYVRLKMLPPLLQLPRLLTLLFLEMLATLCSYAMHIGIRLLLKMAKIYLVYFQYL